MRPILLSAIALLLISCASQLPQSPPSGIAAEVKVPEVRVGSFWRYAVSDGFTRLPRAGIEYRVSAVNSGVMTVAIHTGPIEAIELYTPDWGWVRRPATNMQVFDYAPPYRALDFPLVAGKKWKFQGRATDPADGRSFPVMIDGEVLGWEKVRVPAGEFDTLKVRRFVFLDYLNPGVRGQSVIQETDWYAPAINQVARRETTSKYWRLAELEPSFRLLRVDRGGGRGDGSSVPRLEQDDWLVFELVEYGTS